MLIQVRNGRVGTRHISVTKEWVINAIRTQGSNAIRRPELTREEAIIEVQNAPGNLIPMCDCDFDPVHKGCLGRPKP